MPTAVQTLLLPNQVDEALAAHFAALGVGTISAYKLWCHRHGLSTALTKRHKSGPQSERFSPRCSPR